MQKIASKIHVPTWPSFRHFYEKAVRTSQNGKGWLLLLIWIGVVFLLVNFFLPKLNPPGLNLYVIQPVLWLMLAALAFWLWKAETPENPFPISRKAIGLAALIGLFQLAVFLLAGLLFGFGNSPYARRIDRVLLNLWFIGSQLIGLEMSRWYLAHHWEQRFPKKGFALTWLLMMLMMIPVAAYTVLNTPLSIFRFIGRTLLPTGANNLLATYLVTVGGPLASLAYLAVNALFEVLSPILPNLIWTIRAFLGTLLPVIGLALIAPFFAEQTPAEANVEEKGKQDSSSLTGWAITAILATILVWFRVGLFGIQPSLVSGPSMTPTLVAGDIIITQVVAPETIQIGDIIRFRQGKADVVHRVIDIQNENGQITFITKGDYNNVTDPPVSASQFEGKVVMVIPKIGWIAIFIRRALAWLF